MPTTETEFRPTRRSEVIRKLRRYVWLCSRERSEALKRTGYRCAKCGAKQSRAKDKFLILEVHHKKGIFNWDPVVDQIMEQLLCDPDYLDPLCSKCHDEAEIEHDHNKT